MWKIESAILAQGLGPWGLLGAGIGIFVLLLLLITVLVGAAWGKLWFQAYMSEADVSIFRLVTMGFVRVSPRVIVSAKIKAS